MSQKSLCVVIPLPLSADVYCMYTVCLKTHFAVVLHDSGKKYVTPVDGDLSRKANSQDLCYRISDLFFETRNHTVGCFVLHLLRFIIWM
jgi:hypothetical protein